MRASIRPLRRTAFTLIEMIVVIAIITLLIALTTPSLRRARYEAKVAICLSNFHEWGNATLAYAGDHLDALPRQDIPQTTGVNTWDVSNEFPVQMVQYGINAAAMWDCPVRGELGSNITTIEQALDRFKSYYGYFSIIPQNWWVPRQFGWAYFPSQTFDPSAEVDHWPATVGDPRGQLHPILTCKVGRTLGQPSDPYGAWGGHQWNGVLESTTLLFTDAHAERRAVNQIARRYSGNWQNFY